MTLSPLSSLLLLLFLPFFLFSSHALTITRDVVVIGGGSSGTYAAVNLRTRGHTVAILEQQNRLGGHVETYHDPETGEAFNVGVLVYYNNTINNAYFSLLGVPVAPVAPHTPATYLDFATGQPVPGFDPNAPFLSALEAYLAYVSETYPYLSLSYENLTYPIPAELLEPFTSFAARHNFTGMTHLLDQEAQNIGNLWQLPTYHAIHAFDPKLITDLLNGFVNAAAGNNQDIYNAAARFIGPENVFLNTTVTRVDRSGACFGVVPSSPVCVLSTTRGNTAASTLIKARKLLVAIPPTLSSLASAALDLDAHERTIFSQFSAVTHGAIVFDAPHLNTTTRYINIGTHTPDHLISLPGAFTLQPLTASGTGMGGKFAAWYGALEGEGWTRERAEALVVAEVARVGGGSTNR